MDSMLDSKPTTSYKPKRKSYQTIFPVKLSTLNFWGFLEFIAFKLENVGLFCFNAFPSSPFSAVDDIK